MLLHLTKTREKLQSDAMENLVNQHKRNKSRHDKNARNHKFSPGDIVFLRVERLLLPHTSKKLQVTYTGPFLITRRWKNHRKTCTCFSGGYRISKRRGHAIVKFSI